MKRCQQCIVLYNSVKLYEIVYHKAKPDCETLQIPMRKLTSAKNKEYSNII